MNKLSPELSNIETWIFDLDNTLYHSSINLFDQIDKRMCSYVSNFLDISTSEAYKVQKSFFREYGTTLRGMMECHNMDPDSYLKYVHDIDFSIVRPDNIMANALNVLPKKKIIFTNATKDYTRKVISNYWSIF